MTETRAARDRREAEAYLDRAFQFLVDDFGYESIGRIPVTTDSVVVRGYVSRGDGVQVELSGDPPGNTFLGGLRKLKDGVPAPYDGDHFVSFQNIALVLRGEHDELLDHNSNPKGWRGVVDTAVQLLKDNRSLLTGNEWIAKERVTAAWNRHFQAKFGFTPDLDVHDSRPMDTLKTHFAFLAAAGYRLVYDSSTLTPHEYLATRELRYQSGSDTVRIHRADFRDGGNWTVSMNGRDIVDSFGESPDAIKTAAARVAAHLR